MSRRDGHEWESLSVNHPSVGCVGCDGDGAFFGACTNKAKWHKSLIACDKSQYSGGYFCDDCKERDDM